MISNTKDSITYNYKNNHLGNEGKITVVRYGKNDFGVRVQDSTYVKTTRNKIGDTIATMVNRFDNKMR